MEKKFELQPPIMPTYIQFKNRFELKQDGFKVDNGFHVRNLTIDEAVEFSELMRDTFMEHWKKLQSETPSNSR